MAGEDAVDESQLTLCCALCCTNCATLPITECTGCSGKLGLCCLDLEICCKPGSPCLPCICCGPTCDGCKGLTAQLQVCCVVCNAAFPCNEEVPVAVVVGGLMLYPKCGCCVVQREIMDR